MSYDEPTLDGNPKFDPYAVNIGYTVSSSGININYADTSGEETVFVEKNMSTEDPKFPRAFDFLAGKLRDNEPVTLAEWEYVLSRHDLFTGAIIKITDSIALLANGTVTHHYDTRKDALHAYIGELVKEGNPQARAYARFAERLEANPSEHAKDMLFDWFIGLTRQGERMSITNDGLLVAYKGVQIIDDVPFSIHQGPGIIENPVLPTVFIESDCLPNRIGSTVSVQRSYVNADPEVGCGAGLHAGTYSYARSWGHGNVLQVEIDPKDVVAIPNCSGFQKIRCARYKVVGFINDPIEVGIVASSDFTWSLEDFEAWEEEGYSVSKAKAYVSRGIELEDAIEMESDPHGSLVLELDAYTDHGFSPLEALRFIRNGTSVEEALEEVEQSYYDEYEDEEDEEFYDYCPEDDSIIIGEIRDVEVTPIIIDNKDETKASPKKNHKKKNKNRKNRKRNKR